MANENDTSVESAPRRSGFNLPPVYTYDVYIPDSLTREQLLEVRADGLGSLAVSATVSGADSQPKVSKSYRTKANADLSWQVDANCRGVNIQRFYPVNSSDNEVIHGTCSECVVRDQCLEYALDNNEEYGIWGGLDSEQRQALKRQRRLENPES